ncbi:Phosphatidylcholine:ceramide cholinephosphotransferase 3 [Pelomyxa schiedti]|nr:Phosphatidylcholine:ceramide cholinephosphotransferase 3 [Pelomyxa schiedti]
MRWTDYLLERLKGEWYLLRTHWKYLVLVTFWFVYCISMVARNLVFYFHEVGRPVLSDRGFSLLPNLENSVAARTLADLPIKIIGLLILILCLYTLIGNTLSTTKPYIYNIMERMGTVFLLGQTLRFFTYVATSLPGVTPICRSYAAGEYQPKTLLAVFTRLAVSPNSNCGDLVFSGHMFTLITFIFTFQYYSVPVFIQPTANGAPSMSKRAIEILNYALYPLILFQIVCILLTRRHYTLDVVVACYVTPLLWHFYNCKFPTDARPPMAVEARATTPAGPAAEIEMVAKTPEGMV